MPRRISLTLIAVLLSACPTLGQPPASADIPADYEIADVRNLPQQFAGAASFRPDTAPDPACRNSLLAEFLRHYYSPWNGGAPLSDLSGAVTTMREHARKAWYGENRRRVPGRELDQ